MSSQGQLRRAWIAWLAVCLIWGTTYLAIKITLRTMPPILMGGIRYMTAGVILAAVLRASGRSLPDRALWPRQMLLSFFMIGLGNGGVVTGSQWLPSGLTAVLIATNPFWMVTVEAVVSGGKQMRRREWIGLITGFAGILVLAWPNITTGGQAAHNFLAGVAAVQIACAGWAVGSAYTRRHVMPGDVLGVAALQMFFGGILMTIAGTVLGDWHRLSFNTQTAAAFGYLTIVGAVIAYAAYSYALRHLDVAVVSLYTYINPIIAVILGTIFLGEPIGWRMFAATALIATGVLIVRPRSG